MTDTPMTPDRDPSRHEELLFMLLHGGAHSETIAQRVVDLALAEAGDEQKAEVNRLRAEVARWRERTEEAETSEAQLKGRVRGLRAQVVELEAAGSRLAAVERLAEEARDKCNHTVDTDLLLDALGMES